MTPLDFRSSPFLRRILRIHGGIPVSVDVAAEAEAEPKGGARLRGGQSHAGSENPGDS